MGRAVTIQVRTVDYAATAATMVLAIIGVVNVMILNIRDRGSELAALLAVGWTDRALTRMIASEGLGIGLLGALPGLVVGLVAATVVTDQLTPTTVVAACAAAATCHGSGGTCALRADSSAANCPAPD